MAKKHPLRKAISLCMALAICLGALTACSGGPNNSSQGDSSQKPESVTITFAYTGTPMEKEAMEKSLAKFHEANPDINVEPMFVASEDEFGTKLTSMMASNTPPDMSYLWEGLAFDWAKEGELLNILDYMKDDPDLKPEDLLDSIWYNWDEGKSLGTNSACEAFALYYNKELFQAADVQAPPTTAKTAWDWDTFVETAKKLTLDANGRNALDPAFDAQNIKQYGVQFSTSTVAWFWSVLSNQGSYISEDGKTFTLNSPEATEAIQKMADLINVHKVAPSPLQAKSMPAPTVALQTKQVAMTIDGQWVLLDLGDAKKQGVIDFGVGVLPKLKDSVTVVVGMPTVIYSATKHPEACWKLYKWMADPEYSLDLHAAGLWMPLQNDWYEKPDLVAKWAENNDAHPEGYQDAVMNQVLKNGVSAPVYYVKNFGKIEAIVNPALDPVWAGEKTAQAALTEIAPIAQAEIQGRYNNNRPK